MPLHNNQNPVFLQVVHQGARHVFIERAGELNAEHLPDLLRMRDPVIISRIKLDDDDPRFEGPETFIMDGEGNPAPDPFYLDSGATPVVDFGYEPVDVGNEDMQAAWRALNRTIPIVGYTNSQVMGLLIFHLGPQTLKRHEMEAVRAMYSRHRDNLVYPLDEDAARERLLRAAWHTRVMAAVYARVLAARLQENAADDNAPNYVDIRTGVSRMEWEDGGHGADLVHPFSNMRVYVPDLIVPDQDPPIVTDGCWRFQRALEAIGVRIPRPPGGDDGPQEDGPTYRGILI